MRIGHWMNFVAAFAVMFAVSGDLRTGELSFSAAQAQLTLEFGRGKKDIARYLEREGYSEIQIIRSGISKVRAQACYEGSRYNVTVKRFGGRVSRGAKIGECRPVFAEAQIIRRLERDKYRRISVYGFDGEVYRIVACQRGNRYRMEVNHYGDVVFRTRVGNCVEGYNLAEVRQRLRDNGYNRHKLIRQNERVYVFDACRKARLYRLRVRRANGKIVRAKQKGRCTPPIAVAKLPDLMEDLGFDRVAIVDRRLPVYAAEGCKGDRLVQVKFNRFGEEMKRDRVGDCDPPLTREDILKLIRDGGGNRTTLDERDGFFIATSCYNNRMYRNRFDKYGKLAEQKRLGACPPAPRLSEVLDRYKDRNLRDIEIYVEGCRRGNRVRIKLDEYGDRIDRERVGRC